MERPWTEEDYQRLIKSVKTYLAKGNDINWSEIAKEFPWSHRACKERWEYLKNRNA